MSLHNTQNAFGGVARAFHWVCAAIVLGLLPLGYYMTQLAPSPSKIGIYDWHKSFGTLVLFLFVLRLGWRAASRQPEGLPTHKPYERALAHATHFLLYACAILMPLSGWVMSSAGEFAHSFFGLFNMPRIVPPSEALLAAGRKVHEITSYTLYGLVGLHFAGALKHHVFDRDATLRRMAPSSGARPAVFAIVIAAFLLLGASALLIARDVADDLARAAPKAEGGTTAEAAPETGESTHLAGSWTILPEDSGIGFQSSVYGQPFRGEFTKFAADIAFDPERLGEAGVRVVIAAGSARTGSEERDDLMKTPAFFDAGAHPEAVFTATRFTRIDDTHFIAHGELALKAAVKLIDLPFTLAIEEDGKGGRTARMQGALRLNRLDYAIGTGEWEPAATLGHEVVVNITIAATQP